MFKVSHVEFLSAWKTKVGYQSQWLKPPGQFWVLVKLFRKFLNVVYLFTGNPDDRHHSFYASCPLWDRPHRAGAIQQDPVQGSARWQQQLPQIVWQMSSRSPPGSGTDSQAPGTDQPHEIKKMKKEKMKIEIKALRFRSRIGLNITVDSYVMPFLPSLYRCMKKLAQTSTRWRTFEPGSVCGMLCRRRSVAPPTRRLSSSRSTGRLFLPSRWHLTEVQFTVSLHHTSLFLFPTLGHRQIL